MSADILSPRCYLKSAIAELGFSLSHWPISGKSGGLENDSYMTDITWIRILLSPPPPVTNSNPNKKRFVLCIDPETITAPYKKRET